MDYKRRGCWRSKRDMLVSLSSVKYHEQVAGMIAIPRYVMETMCSPKYVKLGMEDSHLIISVSDVKDEYSYKISNQDGRGYLSGPNLFRYLGIKLCPRTPLPCSWNSVSKKLIIELPDLLKEAK